MKYICTLLLLILFMPFTAAEDTPTEWKINAAIVSDWVYEKDVVIYSDGRTANKPSISEERLCTDRLIPADSLRLLSGHITAIPESIPNRSNLSVRSYKCSHEPQIFLKVTTDKSSRKFSFSAPAMCYTEDMPTWLTNLGSEVLKHYEKIKNCEQELNKPPRPTP